MGVYKDIKGKMRIGNWENGKHIRWLKTEEDDLSEISGRLEPVLEEIENIISYR